MPTPSWSGIPTGSLYSFINLNISSFMVFDWIESIKSSPDTEDFHILLNYFKSLFKTVKLWTYPPEKAPIVDLIIKKITWGKVSSPFLHDPRLQHSLINSHF